MRRRLLAVCLKMRARYRLHSKDTIEHNGSARKKRTNSKYIKSYKDYGRRSRKRASSKVMYTLLLYYVFGTRQHIHFRTDCIECYTFYCCATLNLTIKYFNSNKLIRKKNSSFFVAYSYLRTPVSFSFCNFDSIVIIHGPKFRLKNYM